ncbi:hypothetical protein CEXT_524761 [Caerostris extrusa]|uniref:Uncharacterized protein n=1 Tax=Caerostris extrusa TaxID=172846 RepID=A0AAV4YAC8_CAEEX|nr:hypothetical protein CEXT_524761 [Caerostris extrusa]
MESIFQFQIITPRWMILRDKNFYMRFIHRNITTGIITDYLINIRNRFNLGTYNCFCFAAFIHYAFLKPGWSCERKSYKNLTGLLYTGAITIGCFADCVLYIIRCGTTGKQFIWMAVLHAIIGIQTVGCFLNFLINEDSIYVLLTAYVSLHLFNTGKPLFWPNWTLYLCCNTLLYSGALAVGSTVGFIRRGMSFLATRRPMDGLFALLHLGGALAGEYTFAFMNGRIRKAAEMVKANR